jgi:hypothetical protein
MKKWILYVTARLPIEPAYRDGRVGATRHLPDDTPAGVDPVLRGTLSGLEGSPLQKPALWNDVEQASSRCCIAQAEEVIFLVQLLAELARVQPVVVAALAQQLGMRAHLADAPVLDHQDAVGAPDGRQAVGDDEAGAPLHQVLHALLDQGLRQGVHRAGSLVHDEDLRVGQHGARQADELLLAGGEQVAALAHLLLVALFQAADEIVCTR